jgi:hypothetical protein
MRPRRANRCAPRRARRAAHRPGEGIWIRSRSSAANSSMV